MSLQPFRTFSLLGRSLDSFPEIQFFYRFDDEPIFTEKIYFPEGNATPPDALDAYLFPLAIALGISYYKLYPFAQIDVKCGLLDDRQREFRQTFYRQGLGEFAYRNDIDPAQIGHFIPSYGAPISSDRSPVGAGHLLLRGGGKDSIVSLGLLTAQHIRPSLFSFGKIYPIHEATATHTGLPRLVVHRTIDPRLFELHQQGYYNGHVPITGIISFVSLLVARLLGFGSVYVSSEKSADVGNVLRKGFDINHQRSKSVEFERLFIAYTHRYIHPDLQYKNLLADLYERQVAERFSKQSDFFSLFSSCNRNFHLDGRTPASRRCNHCPKCLFVYMILRPFITAPQTKEIRGNELYQDASLLTLAREIWGFVGIKPFECVGTPAEAVAMTQRFVDQLPRDHLQDRPLLDRFVHR